jgi:hypothetical protein
MSLPIRSATLAVSAALAAALTPAPARAETPLYETGPGQDSAFVRFLNATGAEVVIASEKGGARLTLAPTPEGRVSRFHAAVAGARQRASIQTGGRPVSVEVVAKAGEYVTVAILPGEGADRTRIVRELPSDYTAARASVALANADPGCAQARLSGGATDAAIAEGVRPFALSRRLVNPVRLSARVACAGEPTAVTVDFGQLQAGERYTVFLIAGPSGRTAFFVIDRVL